MVTFPHCGVGNVRKAGWIGDELFHGMTPIVKNRNCHSLVLTGLGGSRTRGENPATIGEPVRTNLPAHGCHSRADAIVIRVLTPCRLDDPAKLSLTHFHDN
ncbi:hypothetical protein C1S65_07920 [Pseudomonas putida]|uniref:Uncharacterized protein n=1 Tax=Pseudomonas putida TaxID=303 RepID=A0AAD0PA94_PSEPU|nr:hypothetical protein C1S65_07920 [Pseudomonas putida]